MSPFSHLEISFCFPIIVVLEKARYKNMANSTDDQVVSQNVNGERKEKKSKKQKKAFKAGNASASATPAQTENK